MTKHESPPFKMVVEAGKLVPATAYDQERLDTFRRGTRVNVSFVRDGGRVMERKWWAILGRAVKECKTPWQTKDEASEAIKLSLGIVNLSKTINGNFMQYPKSLTELEDPELDEAVMQMMGIIQHITGVDPDEWKKQIGDLGQDEQPETSDSPTHKSDAESGVAAPIDPALDSEPGDASGDSSDTEALPGSDVLADEDKDNLLALIRRLKASVGPDETVVKATAHSFAAEGRTMSDLAKRKAQRIVEHFREVCRGELDEDTAVELACGMAGVDQLELGAD